MLTQKKEDLEVPPKVFTYLRVSSQSRVTGDTWDRQRQAIAGWLRTLQEQPEHLGEWRDEGLSGEKEWIDRPGMTGLIQRVQAHVEDDSSPDRYWAAVLVERQDRFARDMVIGELLLRDLGNLGVKVISVSDNNDISDAPDDPGQRLIRRIMNGVAEYERDSLVIKMRKARERKKAKEGRCEGAKPFGYYANERPVLETICRQAQRGFGARQISHQLNAHNRGEATLVDCNPKWGYPPRSGRKWHASQVQRILDRERKAGRL
jgi:DNA invertase Pin-like site-specific DNA recombinase